MVVYLCDALNNIFKLIHSCVLHTHPVRLAEIAPNIGSVFDRLDFFGRYALCHIDIEMLEQILLTMGACVIAVVKDMKSIVIGVLRINTVSRKAAAESV